MKKISPSLHHMEVVLFNLRRKDEATQFFADFFTESEKIALSKRLAIALLLQQGHSYEEITKTLQVSTATISFVSEQSKTPGLQLALEKIAEDDWAESFLQNVYKLFGHV